MKESFKIVTYPRQAKPDTDLSAFTLEQARKARDFHASFDVYAQTPLTAPVSYTHLDVYKRQELAMADGVEFCELMAPKALHDGMLTCEEMELSLIHI